jgi:hypothetical protein
MSVRTAAGKLGVASMAVVAFSTGVVGMTAGPASAAAKTISFCSNGSAAAFVHILPARVPGSNMTTREGYSFVLSNGGCWTANWDTLGQAVQVDVVQIRSDGRHRWLGLVNWNSDVRLFIEVKGDAENPRWNRWRVSD